MYFNALVDGIRMATVLEQALASVDFARRVTSCS